jgi:hypothetical protein
VKTEEEEKVSTDEFDNDYEESQKIKSDKKNRLRS